MRFEPLGKGTLLSRLDVRVKLAVLLLFAWKIALSNSFFEVLAFIPFILFLLSFLRSDLVKVFKVLVAADLFLVFLVLTASFYGKEGIFLGLLLFFKSNEILLISVSMLMTSEPFQIFRAFRELKLPPKLVQLFFLTYRYIFTVYEEYSVLVKSAKCRGFKPKTSLQTYKTYGYIMANLLVKSYFRADRVYKAMLSRGFKGEFPAYRELVMKREDYVFAAFSVILFALVEIWNLSGQKIFM